MAIDLTGIEGLSEAQIAAINERNEADVTGLKANAEALKQEKLGVQERVTQAEQEREDARLSAAKAKEDALKASNDMEGLRKHYEDQLAESTASNKQLAEQAQQRLLDRDTGDTLNQALGLIHDKAKWSVKAELSNMLKISYNDQGEKVTAFESGGQTVANSVEEFSSWAATQDNWKEVLNGADSSGAGVTQSKSGGATTQNTVQANLEARLRSQGIQS